MRIVSQNKIYSVEFREVMVFIQDEYINATLPFNKTITLGKYKDEERAKEVFDDLHKTYCGLNSILFQNIDVSDDLLAEMRKNPKPIIVRTEKDNQKVEMLPIAYYMPQE